MRGKGPEVPQLGCKMKVGGYGSEGGVPETPGITAEPSGDVVDLSMKRQRRRVRDDITTLPLTTPIPLATSRVSTH